MKIILLKTLVGSIAALITMGVLILIIEKFNFYPAGYEFIAGWICSASFFGSGEWFGKLYKRYC